MFDIGLAFFEAEQMILTLVSRCSAVLLFFAVASNSWAQTFDPAAAYEQGWTTSSNPNSVWSYGYSLGLGDPVTLYDSTSLNSHGSNNGPYAQYWVSSTVNIGNSPSAEFNNGPAYDDTNVDFLANQFVLVAGIGGQYSDLVFTAPTSGIYSIAGNFRGDQYGVDTAVGLTANGAVLFNSSVAAEGQTAPFDTEVSLTSGNTVVFSAVRIGGKENTGLSATITTLAVPEPGTIALLGVSAVSLAGLAWRRRRTKT